MQEPQDGLSYQRKAIEIARAHWQRHKDRAIRDRETFHGLQIVPKASYYDDSQGRRPGENNWVGFGFDLHPHVAFTAAGLVLLFIASTVIFSGKPRLNAKNASDRPTRA